MPYATCPNCKSLFHLNIKASELEAWCRRYPLSEDDVRYIQCYFCWRELEELDVVQVWCVPEGMENVIAKGDKGTVILIHDKDNYEVEAVNRDGSTKWIQVLPRNCIWYSFPG